jgi:hypothetical protein
MKSSARTEAAITNRYNALWYPGPLQYPLPASQNFAVHGVSHGADVVRSAACPCVSNSRRRGQAVLEGD